MSSGNGYNNTPAPDKRARTAVITQAVNALVGEHEAGQRQRQRRPPKKDQEGSQKKSTPRSRSSIKERTLNRLVLLAKDNNDKCEQIADQTIAAIKSALDVDQGPDAAVGAVDVQETDLDEQETEQQRSVIQEQAALLLAWLSTNAKVANMIVERFGCGPLFQLLRDAHNHITRRRVLQTILYLAQEKKTRKLMVSSDLGGVPLLMQLLSSTHMKVRARAADIIACLAQDEAHRYTIVVTAGALRPLVKMLCCTDQLYRGAYVQACHKLLGASPDDWCAATIAAVHVGAVKLPKIHKLASGQAAHGAGKGRDSLRTAKKAASKDKSKTGSKAKGKDKGKGKAGKSKDQGRVVKDIQKPPRRSTRSTRSVVNAAKKGATKTTASKASPKNSVKKSTSKAAKATTNSNSTSKSNSGSHLATKANGAATAATTSHTKSSSPSSSPSPTTTTTLASSASSASSPTASNPPSSPRPRAPRVGDDLRYDVQLEDGGGFWYDLPREAVRQVPLGLLQDKQRALEAVACLAMCRDVRVQAALDDALFDADVLPLLVPTLFALLQEHVPGADAGQHPYSLPRTAAATSVSASTSGAKAPANTKAGTVDLTGNFAAEAAPSGKLAAGSGGARDGGRDAAANHASASADGALALAALPSRSSPLAALARRLSAHAEADERHAAYVESMWNWAKVQSISTPDTHSAASQLLKRVGHRAEGVAAIRAYLGRNHRFPFLTAHFRPQQHQHPRARAAAEEAQLGASVPPLRAGTATVANPAGAPWAPRKSRSAVPHRLRNRLAPPQGPTADAASSAPSSHRVSHPDDSHSAQAQARSQADAQAHLAAAGRWRVWTGVEGTLGGWPAWRARCATPATRGEGDGGLEGWLSSPYRRFGQLGTVQELRNKLVSQRLPRTSLTIVHPNGRARPSERRWLGRLLPSFQVVGSGAGAAVAGLAFGQGGSKLKGSPTSGSGAGSSSASSTAASGTKRRRSPRSLSDSASVLPAATSAAAASACTSSNSSTSTDTSPAASVPRLAFGTGHAFARTDWLGSTSIGTHLIELSLAGHDLAAARAPTTRTTTSTAAAGGDGLALVHSPGAMSDALCALLVDVLQRRRQTAAGAGLVTVPGVDMNVLMAQAQAPAQQALTPQPKKKQKQQRRKPRASTLRDAAPLLLPHLQSLSLAGCRLGEAGAAAVAELLRTHRLPRLASLDLADNAIGLVSQRGIVALAHGLRAAFQGAAATTVGGVAPLPAPLALRLRWLSLRGNHVHLEGACALAALLKGGDIDPVVVDPEYHPLHALYRGICSSAAGGAAHVDQQHPHPSRPLLPCPLTALDLSCNYVGVTGAEALADSLVRSVSLAIPKAPQTTAETRAETGMGTGTGMEALELANRAAAVDGTHSGVSAVDRTPAAVGLASSHTHLIPSVPSAEASQRQSQSQSGEGAVFIYTPRGDVRVLEPARRLALPVKDGSSSSTTTPNPAHNKRQKKGASGGGSGGSAPGGSSDGLPVSKISPEALKVRRSDDSPSSGQKRAHRHVASGSSSAIASAKAASVQAPVQAPTQPPAPASAPAAPVPVQVSVAKWGAPLYNLVISQLTGSGAGLGHSQLHPPAPARQMATTVRLPVVRADPFTADSALRNAKQLAGKVAWVQRGVSPAEKWPRKQQQRPARSKEGRMSGEETEEDEDVYWMGGGSSDGSAAGATGANTAAAAATMNVAVGGAGGAGAGADAAGAGADGDAGAGASDAGARAGTPARGAPLSAAAVRTSSFSSKAIRCLQAGAVAVIVSNSDARHPDHVFEMSASTLPLELRAAGLSMTGHKARAAKAAGCGQRAADAVVAAMKVREAKSGEASASASAGASAGAGADVGSPTTDDGELTDVQLSWFEDDETAATPPSLPIPVLMVSHSATAELLRAAGEAHFVGGTREDMDTGGGTGIGRGKGKGKGKGKGAMGGADSDVGTTGVFVELSMLEGNTRLRHLDLSNNFLLGEGVHSVLATLAGADTARQQEHEDRVMKERREKRDRELGPAAVTPPPANQAPGGGAAAGTVSQPQSPAAAGGSEPPLPSSSAPRGKKQQLGDNTSRGFSDGDGDGDGVSADLYMGRNRNESLQSVDLRGNGHKLALINFGHRALGRGDLGTAPAPMECKLAVLHGLRAAGGRASASPGGSGATSANGGSGGSDAGDDGRSRKRHASATAVVRAAGEQEPSAGGDGGGGGGVCHLAKLAMLGRARKEEYFKNVFGYLREKRNVLV